MPGYNPKHIFSDERDIRPYYLMDRDSILSKAELNAIEKAGATYEDIINYKNELKKRYETYKVKQLYDDYIKGLIEKGRQSIQKEEVKPKVEEKKPASENTQRIAKDEHELAFYRKSMIRTFGKDEGEAFFQKQLNRFKDVPGFAEIKRRFEALPENAAASSLQTAPTTSTRSTPPQATTQRGKPSKSKSLLPGFDRAMAAAEDIGVPKDKKRELIVDVGDQYDPETGKLISPEKINLLVAQETARRLANKPYEANPYNRSAGMNELEKGGYRVLNDLVQEGMNPRSSAPFTAPRSRSGVALDRFSNQEYKLGKAMTLKDRLISDIRANAQARLQDSFHDMGMKLSSQKIGRSGIDDLLKARMTENMNRELNQLDSKMAMDLVAQQNQLSGQETDYAFRMDELEHKKALDQYRLNKIEEEARKEEQRKNALNAVSQGSALRQTDQEDLNRKAQEFDRKTKHHDTQVDSYIRRVNEARIGAPAQILPDRIQGFAPTHMQGVQPGQLARMPLAGGEPIITPVEPDTTKKDIASALAAGTGLFLKNKEIDKMK